jgi:hypothetical protein
LELQRDLGVGQARVDRRDRGAEPPAREQQDHELDPVAQLDGHHIAGAYAELVEVSTRGSNTLQ